MRGINTKSKIIPFSEKNMKTFQECAAQWIDVEGIPESKVAVKALLLLVHHSQHRPGVGIAAAVAADAAPGDDHDDECDASAR